MRAVLLRLVLPLLLLCSQQGALLHELAHATGRAQESAAHKGDAADTLCVSCLAFAHLAAAAAPAVAAVALPPFVHGLPAALPRAWRAADAPRARSRGPPRFP